MKGRVQRLSVGVQSFNNDLLKQMDRYKKYGSGEEIFERIGQAASYFDSVNVDMIFNFPSQTEDILLDDLEKIVACGARQTTFSPLYVSSATTRKMDEVAGQDGLQPRVPLLPDPRRACCAAASSPSSAATPSGRSTA